MCTHDIEWARETGVNMAEALSLVAEDIMPADVGVDGVWVWINRLADQAGQVVVRNYVIVWSELTRSQKGILCFDTNVPTKSCPNPEYEYSRARLNGQLKSRLLNDCLADAIIYAGPNGEMIRDAFRDTIREIDSKLRGGVNIPLFLVAESLGSKILADALIPKDATSAEFEALAALATTRQIFMAANQIPILDLAVPFGTRASASAAPDKPAIERLRDAIQNRRTDLFQMRGFDVVPEEDILIVAFTDPNDLLSYRIPEARTSSIINVLVSNAPTWFTLIEDPMAAHTGYLANKKVWELISCGSDLTCEDRQM